MRNSVIRIVTSLAPAVLLAMACPRAAWGQNALGSGNALDAGLKPGEKSNPRGRDIRQELSFRNAIVTGNAGAGLSFRGDIGYRAASDFRSTSGADDLYSFQRDTTYSGLATMNIRGIGGLQNQLSMTTGGQTDRGLIGDLIVQRPSSGFSGQDVADARVQGARLDPFARVGGSLRSPSVGLLREVDRPDVLAVNTRPAGPGASTRPEAGARDFLVASGLQGVRNLNELNPAFGYRPTPIKGFQTADQVAEAESKRMSELEDQKTGAETPGFVSPFDAYRRQLRDKSGLVDSSVKTLLRPTELPAEERAKLGLPDSGTGAPSEATAESKPDPFEERMENFRKLLADTRESQRAAAKGEGPRVPGINTPGVAGESEASGTPTKPIDDSTPRTSRDARIRMAVEEAKQLLKEGQKFDGLRPLTSLDEIFAEHMAKGEEHLTNGRWFDAEERYSAALSMRPGDPMAAAGRVHAQIAAGMYLSAAVNLRNTFRAYPELIVAKYDQKLLPRGERLEQVRAQLRIRSQRDSLVARDAGLLLAYLGWQTNNAADVTDGFGIIDRVNESINLDPDPLDAALRAVWNKQP